MVASNLFCRGIGVKTIQSILKRYPDIINEQVTLGGLNEIIGIDMKTSKLFLSNIDKFKIFITCNELGKYCKVFRQTKNETSQIRVCFTGGKDKALMTLFNKKNIVVDNTMNCKVNYLITNDPSLVSTKTKYAEKHNIEIITKENMMIKLNTL